MGLGLPEDAPPSVMAIEVFGKITSIFKQVGWLMKEIKKFTTNNREAYNTILSRQQQRSQALSNAFGQYHILRTSPLTEVPFVCCPTCEV